MGKLTPTFNDVAHGANGGGAFIAAPHEPLKMPGAFPWVSESADPTPATAVNQPSPEPQKPLKIALIGTAPSSRMLAPFNDPSWTIWACSPGNMGALPRVDAWFEIHGNMLWPENKHYGEPYLKWLNEQSFPVYMQNQSFLPRATPLPMRELVEEFGPYFFTSSFAWMMALAMKQGATEISLYGIDMASRDEYILQRPGAYYFFMEGKRRGIKMSAPYESDIMQPPTLYGFSEVTQFGRKLLARKVEIKSRVDGMKQQRDSLNHQIAYLEGAQEDLDYMESIFGGVQNNSLTHYGQG